MIFYVSPRRDGLKNYINGRWRHVNYPEIRGVSYEDVFSWNYLRSGTWIFAGVEQLPSTGKKLADRVWQTLTDSGQTVLNRPKLLPSRHGLLETMYLAGINKFRSSLPARVDDSLRYPVFVREAEKHTGSISGLIYSRRQLDNFLRWKRRLRGYKLHELLVIELCDTSNELGEYRKYSAQYVAGAVAASYLHVDKQWMVKAHGSTFQDEWSFEEREFIRRNAHAEKIKKIFELAKIEYGRIDYGLLNGKIQVWEINTHPTIGPPPHQSNVARTPQRIRQLQEPGKKLFFERFQSMLESIDSPSDPEVTIELSLPTVELQNWRREVEGILRPQQRRKILGELSAWPPLRKVRDTARQILDVPDR